MVRGEAGPSVDVLCKRCTSWLPSVRTASAELCALVAATMTHVRPRPTECPERKYLSARGSQTPRSRDRTRQLAEAPCMSHGMRGPWQCVGAPMAEPPLNACLTRKSALAMERMGLAFGPRSTQRPRSTPCAAKTEGGRRFKGPGPHIAPTTPRRGGVLSNRRNLDANPLEAIRPRLQAGVDKHHPDRRQTLRLRRGASRHTRAKTAQEHVSRVGYPERRKCLPSPSRAYVVTSAGGILCHIG